jgi:hypothetical protein
MQTAAANPAFKRRQRVLVGNAAGPRVDRGSIVSRHKGTDWYVVRFEDGAEMSAHVSSIKAIG